MSGKVQVSGWEESTEISDIELAKRAEGIGIESIIYTSISKDGTLSGPDIDATRRIAQEVKIPIVHSGGISSTEDIQKIIDADIANLGGIITGKAVYEQKFDLEQVIKDHQKEPEGTLG